MTILVAYDGIILNLPPLLSLLKVLVSLGHEVSYLGVPEGDNEKLIESIGVRAILVPRSYPGISLLRHPVDRLSAELTKRHRRNRDLRIVRQIVFDHMHSNARAIVWTIGYSVLHRIGLQLATYGRRHINTAYELEDLSSSRYQNFDYLSCLKFATLVQCEVNRAEIFAAINHLDQVPFVIPNCPYAHPRERNLTVPVDEINRLVQAWIGRSVFLYQGSIGMDRSGLIQNLEKLCRSFPDAVVAVMPSWTDGDYGNLPKYDNFCLLPNLPAPDHLLVTSHASIGVAYYARKLSTSIAFSPLNAIYCAPNKIFEFSGFGIPTIGNDIPGLRYSIGESGAGVCFDERETSIVDASRLILSDYGAFSRRATAFFERADLIGSIQTVLDSALSIN